MNAAKSPDSFGEWVRTRRRQLDLTQAGLGKRAGCSEAAIRKIEADERKPSRQLADLLARALEITESEIEIFLQSARGVITEDIDIGRTGSRLNPNNLPVLLTSTVNRTHDLELVTKLITDPAIHLVTIIGPPGIGKTRLSIQCGYKLLQEFPDGVWFVDLAELTDSEFFIPAVARSLGSVELPPSPDFQQVLEELREKRLLLLLDNFEHLVTRAALDVAGILKSCPAVKVLVSSRAPIHIYGEHEYPLPSLSIPPRDAGVVDADLMQYESVQLFVARTRQHQSGFTITPQNAAAVVEICSILEGIPLALELAAASLRQMSLEEMASILGKRDWIKHIGTSARDLPARQRTLENVIDWSYQLLNGAERVFFDDLCVLSGWFDTAAAAVITGTDQANTPGILNSLTDHSLLVREMKQGRTHWRMWELIREFAGQKLNAERRFEVELRRAGHFLGQMKALKVNAMDAARSEYYHVNASNLHAALQWAILHQQFGLAFQLAEHLDEYWTSLGYMNEGLAFMRQLLASPPGIEAEVYAAGLELAADLAWQLSDFETALDFSKRAVELARIHGLNHSHPRFLNRMGRIQIEEGNLDDARVTLQKALEHAILDPEVLNPGSPLAQLGEVEFFQGNLDEAKALFQQALSLLDEKDDIFLSMAKTDLAEIALAQGDLQGALSWLAGIIDLVRPQVRRSLVFLCALAGYLVLSPEKFHVGIAAQIYGAVESYSARSGVVLGGFYRELNRHRVEIGRCTLTPMRWDELHESGRKWTREDALQQARRILNL